MGQPRLTTKLQADRGNWAFCYLCVCKHISVDGYEKTCKVTNIHRQANTCMHRYIVWYNRGPSSPTASVLLCTPYFQSQRLGGGGGRMICLHTTTANIHSCLPTTLPVSFFLCWLLMPLPPILCSWLLNALALYKHSELFPSSRILVEA